MKTVFNIVLGLCALALVYICYASIMGPINFEKAKKQRDAAVIARLIDIRKAQLEYRGLHNQQYTASFDTLIDFVKNQKLPFIFKQGELDDKQLEDGLTEKKAINIINKAKKTGNYAEVKKWGLENFKRDTMWVAVLDVRLSDTVARLEDRYFAAVRRVERFVDVVQAHGVLAVGGIQFHDNLVGQAADSRSDTAGCRQVDFTVGSHLAGFDDGDIYFSHETVAYFLRHLPVGKRRR